MEINGSTSDGFHTFDELYHHRTMLFASLCNLFHRDAWKSRLHDDGTMYDGYFIAGIGKVDSATYHCAEKYWDLFLCEELDTAPPFDGHTPEDTLKRIYKNSLSANK